ncbi:MAG: flagellin lysine-N-methylase [Clostridia bacterium]|nr:flagellin lysine-N-methylase [Clostridia bacterium]
MRLISPDYYPQFRCIADKCRHSCCIGWEIDIDTDTREKYRRVPGEFGARLNAAIEDGEVSCFRMLKVGQSPTSDSDYLQSPSVASTRPCAEGWPVCPMLNQNGLCDLITELGEDHLCQICADHPRFRNYFSDRTEIGLGLCCEEAARIILSQEEPMRLIVLEDDGADDEPNDEEAALLALRGELIALMQDRARPIEARLDALLDAVNLAIPERDWAAVYRGLERLDPAWDSHIERLSTMGAKGRPESLHPFATAFEQFCVYLLYRHLPGALEDDDVAGRVAFCVLSTRVLMALCAAKTDCTMADLLDFARMYSAEIEYSEDNIAALLDALWED